MPGPTFIDGAAVSLRTIEEEDVETLQGWVNDARIRRPIGRSRPLNREQEREWVDEVVADDESVHLAVAVDAAAVGIVGLAPIDFERGTAELGYWIAPDHQRQGYGTEAVELLVGHGFDQLGLHRIGARVFAFNDPSARLLERVGFRHEGTLRETAFLDGEYHDTHWYGLLASEWRGRASGTGEGATETGTDPEDA
jgi:RimJ/RimL family protein N-acetyltransferase